MHSATSRSSQSSLQSSIPNASTSSLLQLQQQQQHHHHHHHHHHRHHQQQQILYGPLVNPVIPLQPYAPGIHPTCIYPTAQRPAGLSTPISLQMQGKANRWQFKNKNNRGQQQHQQQHTQQPFYNSKLVFEQGSNNPTLPSSNSSFILTSSNFPHGGHLGESYNNSAMTLIPQTPYAKSPDNQAFCLLQDRDKSQLVQRQQSSARGSYYNISSANVCNLQTVNQNAFQLANVNPYSTFSTSFTNSQITGPIQTVQTTQVFPNPQIGLLFAGQLREKLSETNIESTSLNAYSKDKLPVVNNTIPINSSKIDNRGDWPVHENKATSVNNFESNPKEPSVPRTVDKLIIETTQEEGAYSDESSASFEFTLEAEKMVSALCNTTSSNDLSKEEARNGKKSEANAFFDGAGDNPSNKNNWFSNFCTDESNKNESNKSIAIQTEGPCTDRSQYPELIRKTAYWGCTKAEIILNSETLESNGKWDRLINLSSATRTAITKSSTCFPIFAGDRIFAKDLIKALLRVSNGWLILDNYLNKQHYPSLAEKLDDELLRCFQTWEESTYELLRQIVETFLKLEENSRMSADKYDKLVETSMASFPGDVTLYTSIDLFDCSKNEPNVKSIRKETNNEISKEEEQRQLAISNLSTDATQKTYRKETKLRSKWTITENLISSIGSEKSLNRTKNNVRTGSRFRNKKASSALSNKIDTSERSVNAEFFHLRSTVMERNHESSKEWLQLKGNRKQEFFFDNNIPPPSMNAGLIYGIQRPTTNMNYDPSIFGNTLAKNFYPGNDNVPIARVDTRTMYENKSNIGAPVYIGKSSTDQLELSAVPKNRMTLLSQIEPDIPEKESEEMTANLSAWFASMRNANGQVQQQQQQQQQQSSDIQHPPMLSHRGDTLARNTIDLTRQLQIDTNRQLQTLRNMQSIQSAPWNAEHILNKRLNVHNQITEEYDSSEDVRVYMKPGSYNVPKKRHHRKSNTRRGDNLRGSGNHYKNTHSSKNEKVPRVLASSTPITRTTLNTTTTQSVSLHDSPTILKRVSSIKNNLEKDVTWKAACASAEILLEALNVKDAKKETIRDDSDDDDDDDIKDIKIEKESDKEDRVSSKRNQMKSEKKQRDDIAEIDASSYEASEDDSGSTGKLSPRTNVLLNSQDNRNTKTNVKTDSWLIRTLNNASMMSKQRRKQNDFAIAESSESSNSSMIEEERTCLTSITAVGMTTTITATTTIKDREETITASREIDITDQANENDHLNEIKKDSESTVGRATYSETVRRSTGFSTGLSSNLIRSVKKKPINSSPSLNYTTIVPIPGRKCYNKDSERSYHLLHKSRKPPCKKTSRMMDDNEDHRSEDGSFFCSKLKMAENERRSLSSMINLSSDKSAASKSFQCKKKGDNNDSIDNVVETKCGSKLNDRGWSVWYSSRRKQSLSPLALNKLEIIYQAICQMDETNIFKYPPSIDRTDRSSTSIGTMKDYCKVIKNPLFLETVEYKIKNRIYHKIEHAVRDFRRIVYNSRIYHKNDNDRVKKIENLSKKLEELFEEHFTNWDFDNINGSPREDSPIRPKFKSTNSSQKTLAGRYGNSKKSPSTVTVAETTSFR